MMLRSLLSLVLLVCPVAAHAAGFWLLDRGVANFARGGADIADPHDPSALYHNPAALAGQKGLQLLLDVQLATDERTFHRAADNIDGTERTYPAASDLWPGFSPSPGGFVTYNFAKLGVPGLTLAAGGYGPPRIDNQFDEGGPQRYSQIQTGHIQAHSVLGAAYELPWLRLRVGGSIMGISQRVNSRLKLYAPLAPTDPETPEWDVDIHLKARRDWVPSGVLALSAMPLPNLVVAASYQFPYTVNADGTADITLGEGFDGVARVEGNRIRLLDLKFPAIARLAAQYQHPNEDYELELAFVWEGWSRNDKMVMRPVDIRIVTIIDERTIDDVVIENRMRDTFSVRLGGAYRLSPTWLLRAGGFYERAAIPPRRLSLGSFDLDKLGATLGARADFRYGIWADMAVGYVYSLPRTVDDSRVVLMNLLTQENLHPIGNGTYENQQLFIFAAVGVALDV